MDFKVSKKSSNFASSQATCKLYLRFSERSGNSLNCERVSLFVTVMSFQELCTKESFSLASPIAFFVRICLGWSVKIGLWLFQSQGFFFSLMSGTVEL